MADQLTTIFFEHTAHQLALTHDANLLNYGPDEQESRVLEALNRFDTHHPLGVADPDTTIDLAGFGTAPIHYTHGANRYLLLSEVADALGMNFGRAMLWAEHQHDFDIRDQRRKDEERGDGRLGWEYMTSYIDLGMCLIADDPQASPDANGRRWSSGSDWLISNDRLPALILVSPWSKEFMDNTLPAFGHAMRKIHGDKLKNIPTVTADGSPTGGNAHDDLFSTDGLTEEEALRRARRGPGLDAAPEV